MSKPKIVTPEEALGIGATAEWELTSAAQIVHSPCVVFETVRDLAYTVATEPERMTAAKRAAVVKALGWAEHVADPRTIFNYANAVDLGVVDV